VKHLVLVRERFEMLYLSLCVWSETTVSVRLVIVVSKVEVKVGIYRLSRSDGEMSLFQS
jgi:hypothetical protein